MVTSAEASPGTLPHQFSLAQNYPQPVQPGDDDPVCLPRDSEVTLTVFDELGREVRATLIQGRQEAGYHEAVFDASHLASGVYMYRLIAGGYVQTMKSILVR